MNCQEHLLAAEAHLLMAEDRIRPEHITAFEAENIGLSKQYLEMAIRSGVETENQQLIERNDPHRTE